VVGIDRRWSEAEAYCSSTGARLASVLSSGDPVVTAIEQTSSSTPRRVWIGLQKTRTDWQYATGTLFDLMFFILQLSHTTQKSVVTIRFICCGATRRTVTVKW